MQQRGLSAQNVVFAFLFSVFADEVRENSTSVFEICAQRDEEDGLLFVNLPAMHGC